MKNSWPKVTLGNVLKKSQQWIRILPNETYKLVTVRLWGKGVVPRGQVTGAEIAASEMLQVRPNQFILSRIDARNGAFGLVPDFLGGAIVSNDFPVFDIEGTRLLPAFIHWMSKTKNFVDLCKAASEGTTNRVRLREDRFLGTAIPLPPLEEQRRIVAKIDELAGKIEEARILRLEIEQDLHTMLIVAFRRITEGAPKRLLGEIAPLCRRPVTVKFDESYPQVAVRSFGRGTFHKPALIGSEVTWEKPFLVKAGDILVSNIKAWEGALAVAKPEDDGRVGSHRYLTLVPAVGVATAQFVCFHLLTPEGLHEVGEASPGSADRNRTLGAKAFIQIPVPTPEYWKQLWFDALCSEVDALRRLQTETAAELDALIPSILDKAFKGGL
jgi:type I restriction enzyme S subunit